MFTCGQMVVTVKKLIGINCKNYVNYGCRKEYKANILILKNTFLQVLCSKDSESYNVNEIQEGIFFQSEYSEEALFSTLREKR